MNKILTSHVGSLPRSQEVVDFIFAREKGNDFDPLKDESLIASSAAISSELLKNL